MIKICCLSDTHNQHSKVIIPECDILIHAGDFSGIGTLQETKAFLEWFNKQPAKHKIFISGNHDLLDQEYPQLFKELLKEYPDVTYLRDEGTVIEGIKFWGRPTTPRFYDWAFMADRDSPKMLAGLALIPSDTDILITHGPALGILDQNINKEHCGCEDLLNELERLQGLKLIIFGHLHQSSGIQIVNNIKHINASVLNDSYKMAFQPKIIDF